MTTKPRDEVGPDGLPLPRVGNWAETKYRFVETYAQLFARSMVGKWQCRAYIDLFAAAGMARVRGSKRIERGTAIRALGVRPPFDRYLLCEKNASYMEAIHRRAESAYPQADVRYVPGDCNARVGDLINELPGRGHSRGTLSLCVADPYRIRDLRFSTIEQLAMVAPGRRRPMDFLILIPSFMDAHRNLDAYLKPGSSMISEFLGQPNWRDDWIQQPRHGPGREFGLFVVDRFAHSMQRLGYLWGGLGDAFLMRATGKKQIYHLALFSRHPLGQKFAREARRYSTPQPDLPGLR